MKFLVAAFLATSVSAGALDLTSAKRHFAAINDVVGQVGAHFELLSHQVNGPTTDVKSFEEAATAVVVTLKNGKDTVEASADLPLFATTDLSITVTELKSKCLTLAVGLKYKKNAFEDAGCCDLVREKTAEIHLHATDLIHAIISKLPGVSDDSVKTLLHDLFQILDKLESDFLGTKCINKGPTSAVSISSALPATGTATGTAHTESKTPCTESENTAAPTGTHPGPSAPCDNEYGCPPTGTAPHGTQTGSKPTGTHPVPSGPCDSEYGCPPTGTSPHDTQTGSKPTGTQPGHSAPCDNEYGCPPSGTASHNTKTGSKPTGTAPHDTQTGSKPTGTESVPSGPCDSEYGCPPTGTAPQDTKTGSKPTGPHSVPSGPCDSEYGCPPTGTAPQDTQTGSKPTGTHPVPSVPCETESGSQPTGTHSAPSGTCDSEYGCPPTGTAPQDTKTGSKPTGTSPHDTKTGSQPTGTHSVPLGPCD
ncbi:hypothetical protein E4U40_007598, partial [Claviceps sp. LM458 group G5]